MRELERLKPEWSRINGLILRKLPLMRCPRLLLHFFWTFLALLGFLLFLAVGIRGFLLATRG